MNTATQTETQKANTLRLRNAAERVKSWHPGRAGLPYVSTEAVPAPPPKTRDMIRVLEDAARVVEEFGWCRHVTIDDKGAFSTDGALLAAGRGSDASYDLMEALRVAVERYVPAVADRRSEDPTPIEQYSDRPNRTAQDIIALFRTTIGGLEDSGRR